MALRSRVAACRHAGLNGRNGLHRLGAGKSFVWEEEQ